ncbi:MAG TPA: gluconate 2-dehydrogenase subunit 3 family protein, partial [Rudaea sp.]
RLAPLAAATRSGEAKPYGSDPKLLENYHPGDLWPLTFTPQQRKIATILCDAIIPADATSPSASAVGVVDFLDEWISAPYEVQRADRKIILDGFAWIDAESARRFAKPLDAIGAEQLHAICDDICWLPKASADHVEAAKFFARLRDLTAGGFYTTPQGRKDLQYVGNMPLPRFDGPPLEVLKKVGLA